MDTIKKSKEINKIYKKGEKYHYPFFSIIIYNDINNEINGNVAFIAGKKNGNAVWRNKSKRKLREIYKVLNFNNNKVLLIANKNLLEYKNQEIIKIIKNKNEHY